MFFGLLSIIASHCHSSLAAIKWINPSAISDHEWASLPSTIKSPSQVGYLAVSGKFQEGTSIVLLKIAQIWHYRLLKPLQGRQSKWEHRRYPLTSTSSCFPQKQFTHSLTFLFFSLRHNWPEALQVLCVHLHKFWHQVWLTLDVLVASNNFPPFVYKFPSFCGRKCYWEYFKHDLVILKNPYAPCSASIVCSSSQVASRPPHISDICSPEITSFNETFEILLARGTQKVRAHVILHTTVTFLY